MIYNTPTKGEDGLYFVKVDQDADAGGRQKKLIQLNGVKITDVSGDDITLNLVSDDNIERIDAIDEENKVAAEANSESWFGKKLSRKVVDGAYTRSVTNGEISTEKIEVTKVFNVSKEEMGVENIQPDKSCDVILEFAGIWFAKKTFGALWNLVQMRIHPEPEPEPEPEPQPSYPEGYAFVDEEQ